MEQFNQGEWHCGRIPGTIVSNTVSDDMPRNADQVRHWGGYLIAESIAPSNLTLLALSKELYVALTELFESPMCSGARNKAHALLKKVGAQ